MHRTLAHLAAGTILGAVTLFVLLLLLLHPALWPSDSSAAVVALASKRPAPVSAATSAFDGAGAVGISATVGVDPDTCATTKGVTVTAGITVVYCLMVENRGDVTWTNYLVRDENSNLSFTVAYTLTPPQGLSPTFYITVAAPVYTSAHHVISLQARNQTGVSAVATDTVEIVVPAIQVTHTVGTDASACATEKSVDVPAGSAVTHCYEVRNLSDVTFLLHEIQDSRLGIVTQAWPFILEPNATVRLTATEVVTATDSSVVTWTAVVSDGLYAIATDSAIVRVPALSALTTVGNMPGPCATSEVVSATVGDEVYYCYIATNVGGVPLENLIVADSLTAQQSPLTPTLGGGDTIVIQVSYPLTQSVTNTVTWQAQTAAGVVVTASATAYADPLARLDVFAYYDVNRNRRQEPLEPNVMSVTVALTATELVSQVQRTDDQGQATFVALPVGRYTMTVSTAGLAQQFFVTEQDKVQSLLIGAPYIFSITVPLTMTDETDSDGDGVPDYIEGPDDDDDNGFANYEDPRLYLRLPFIMR